VKAGYNSVQIVVETVGYHLHLVPVVNHSFNPNAHPLAALGQAVAELGIKGPMEYLQV